MTDDPALQKQYEWVRGQEVYQYAQASSFSLLAFTVPLRTTTAEFHVKLGEEGSKPRNKTVLLSLRRASIPVVQLYNETFPLQYTLPGDQQNHHVHTDRRTYTVTLQSPTPGRVFLAATVINPIDDVIQALRWGEKMEGTYSMDVSAVYTLRPDVTSLDTDRVTNVTLLDGQPLTMSFRVPAFTTSYDVILSGCQTVSSANCSILMTVSDTLSAEDTSTSRVNCTDQGELCSLRVESPLVDQESYVTFSFSNVSSTDTTSFNLMFYMQGCSDGLKRYIPQSAREDLNSSHGDYTPALYRSAVGLSPYLATDDLPPCLNLGLLGRVGLPSSSDFAFSSFFALWTTEGDFVPVIDVMVPDFRSEIRSFVLQDMMDSGGVLVLEASLLTTRWTGIVWICAMANRLAGNGSVDQCPGGALLQLDLTSGPQAELPMDIIYLPFPVAATWYLSMQSQCWGESGPERCRGLPMVRMWVNMTQCAPDACGTYGTCSLYMEATTVFAACQCQAGYRGLICNDTTYALTKEEQLRAVYLLTLSNFAFLPAIVLAVYRRYFTLAAIFFFNFFFSAFYHACDASHVYQLCITDYDALQFCDFFGSELSFWGVLLTMARIPEGVRTFLLVSGAMVIALLEADARHNDLALVAPIVVAGLIVVASWGWEMRRRRQLFPTRRRYLLCLLPGVLLALSGILVKYFVRPLASYQYGHSYWHLAVMIAPCFLMPPPRRREKATAPTGLSVSSGDVRPSDAHAEELGQENEAAMFDASMNSLGINTDRQNLIS